MESDDTVNKHVLILVLLCLLSAAYIVPLGLRPLFEPDEVRYAEIPREMIASGDWVVPRLNGFRYFEKPPLGYWATALSMKAFGQNEFAVRLPMALSALIVAFALFLFARRFFKSVQAPELAAAVFLTMGGVYAIGTFCVLDMLLTMFLSIGIVFFFFAYVEPSAGRKALYLALFGLCCGGAFLTKGFLAFAVPCVVIGPFLLWERRPGQLLRLPWIPIVAAILVTLPWAILVHKREPDFWRYFFWEEHVRRFFAQDAQHREPFWFYVPMILALAMPWTLFAPSATIGLRRKGLKDPATRLAICWLLFPFLFFSAAKGKLGTYILPCLPPLALLTVHGLYAYSAAEGRRLFNVTGKLLSWVLALGSAGLLLWQVGPFNWKPYGMGEGWKVAVAIACVTAWAAALHVAAARKNAAYRVFWIAAGPCLLLITGNALLPDSIVGQKAPGVFLARNAERIRESGRAVYAQRSLVQATCWQFKRADVRLLGLSSEFRYGATFSDAAGRVTPLETFADFLTHSSTDTLVSVLAYERHYAEFRPMLPPPVFENMNGAFALAQYRGGGKAPQQARQQQAVSGQDDVLAAEQP